MPLRELMGTSVEIAPAGFHLTDRVLNNAPPRGRGHVVVDADHAILEVAGVATFVISEGRRIRVEPVPGAPAGAVSMYLHGTVAALLLAQRGRFALHASVVDIGGLGVALAGRRGAGKSTTALRLAQRGHPLVTDDVSPLEQGALVTVHPFGRAVHVSPEAAEGLGLDVSQARPLVPGAPKLALPEPVRSPVPLGAIVVVRVAGSATVEASPVRGAKAHSLVRTNVYRAQLLAQLWESELFEWAGSIAAQVPVHVVTRPSTGWTIDAVADAAERIAVQSRRHTGVPPARGEAQDADGS